MWKYFDLKETKPTEKSHLLTCSTAKCSFIPPPPLVTFEEQLSVLSQDYLCNRLLLELFTTHKIRTFWPTASATASAETHTESAEEEFFTFVKNSRVLAYLLEHKWDLHLFLFSESEYTKNVSQAKGKGKTVL